MAHNAGCRGLFTHQHIVDWLRFELVVYLRTYIQERFYIVPDVLCAHSKGTLYPDLVLAFDDGHVLFEVGRSQMGKYPDYATIHIAFDGSVSVVNAHRGSKHIAHIADIIESTLPTMLSQPVQVAMC